MKLKVINGQFSICKLPPKATIPQWVYQGSFFNISKTDEEISLVCESNFVEGDIQSEDGWALIKVMGPLDFSLTGILSSIANPLAEAGISLFAISTFDTDYILVKNNKLNHTKQVLEDANFKFE